MTVPVVIVNPIAGRGRGAASKEEIARAFQQAGQPVEILVTNQPGDAVKWAYEAAQRGVPFIAGAGGDGTANEIMNGLSRWLRNGGDPGTMPRFGMIPVGTGNDFGYNFDLPHEVPAACQRLLDGRVRWMDVGLVESDTEPPLFFVNGVGLGFDAVVNIESRKIRYLRGRRCTCRRC
jgi:diacylglycerol kinase (ATP)